MAFAVDDPVVTPSNRRARVRRVMGDGRIEVQYLVRDDDKDRDGLVVLEPKLLRPVVAGKDQPEPVRVDIKGRTA